MTEHLTFCPECGPNVKIDEDGCCVGCGATAIGPGVDRLRATNAEQAAEIARLQDKVAKQGNRMEAKADAAIARAEQAEAEVIAMDDRVALAEERADQAEAERDEWKALVEENAEILEETADANNHLRNVVIVDLIAERDEARAVIEAARSKIKIAIGCAIKDTDGNMLMDPVDVLRLKEAVRLTREAQPEIGLRARAEQAEAVIAQVKRVPRYLVSENGVRRVHEKGRWIIADALDRALTTDSADGDGEDEDPLQAAAVRLLSAAHNYWEVYRKARGGKAVVWLENEKGNFVLFTRGEYRNAIMAAAERETKDAPMLFKPFEAIAEPTSEDSDE